ncbi:MAG: type II secretion system F family protein [Alphaproteobacteria bacterium]|nr:type II secretion system F family protein [Alphaproteobacteria bacterium]
MNEAAVQSSQLLELVVIAVPLVLVLTVLWRLLTAGESEREYVVGRKLKSIQRMVASTDGLDGVDSEDGLSSSMEGVFASVRRFANSIFSATPFVGEKDQAKLRSMLVRAGFRSSDAPNILLLAKLCFALIGFAAGYFYFVEAKSSLETLTFSMFGLVAGAFLPEFVVKRLAARRRRAVADASPDALDLLVLCAEAGIGIEDAIRRVAGEMASAAPALVEDLKIAEAEMRFIPDKRRVFDNLAERTGVDDFHQLGLVLAQGERFGTPLAQSLRTMAMEARRIRLLRTEASAARLPAVMSVPLILFFVPPVIVVAVGPPALRLIEAFSQ